MIQCFDKGVFLKDGHIAQAAEIPAVRARENTMAWQILQAHNVSGDAERLQVRFDAMVSHDITYVGIIQQARVPASPASAGRKDRVYMLPDLHPGV